MKRIRTTEEIRECISRNILNPQLGVEFLADQCGISYSYLYELVSMAFDMSPRQLIEAIRLDLALENMVNSDSSIMQICKRVGYTNSKTFRRAFKKRFNMRPVDCRNHLRTLDHSGAELERLKALLWKQEEVLSFPGHDFNR